MSQTSEINGSSSLHLVDLVDVDDRPVPIGREHDGEAHGDLRGGDDEHEDHEHAPALVERAEASRERDERQVRGVQHELDAHEDHHRVPASKHARAADEEETGRDRDVVAERDHRRCLAVSGSSRWVRTIAPTIAARSSTDAISNANAKSVKMLVASGRMSPPPGVAAGALNEKAKSTTGIATAATSATASGYCFWKKSAYDRSPPCFVNWTPKMMRTVIAPT